jgi:hypothetical protein
VRVSIAASETTTAVPSRMRVGSTNARAMSQSESVASG